MKYLNKQKITFIVHAGYGKTGSTAIQKFLFMNKDKLLDNGYLYTGYCFGELTDGKATRRYDDESELFYDEAELFSTYFEEIITSGPKKLNAFFNNVQNILEKVCSQHNVHTIIWSNEMILQRYAYLGEVIKKLSEFYKVKFLVYLRRQDQWIISAYKQWGVKQKTYMGPVAGFKTWKKLVGDIDRYDLLLKEWESFVNLDDMYIRIYTESMDIIEDFSIICALDISKYKKSKNQYNLPWDDTLLMLAKIYNNQYVCEKYSPELENLFEYDCNLTNKEFKSTELTLDYPTTKELEEVYKKNNIANKKLTRYSKSDYQVIFPDIPVKNINKKEIHITQIVSALLSIMVEQNKNIRELKKKFVELEKRLD